MSSEDYTVIKTDILELKLSIEKSFSDVKEHLGVKMWEYAKWLIGINFTVLLALLGLALKINH